ncbi:MAG: hypothetical protein JSW61_10360 [Candidatus Thorarchaeota archaeon]|nr:MAG: hypothetical protein JSW61_10360 [Candidatus Thorarchaeota archaeon]
MMSTSPVCPYCGTINQPEPRFEYDEKVDIRCDNCGGVFEYLPGFGAFSIGERVPSKGRATRVRDGTVWPISRADEADMEGRWYSGPCGRACALLCCFAIIFPFILYVILFLETLIGLF